MTNIVPLERPDAGEVHSGQVRMAHRLARRFDKDLLHVHGIGWHRWDGRRWVLDDCGEAKRAVLTVLRDALAESVGGDTELRRDVRKCESASGIAGVLDVAAALRPMAAAVRELDADPHLLNVGNGTVNLRTGRLWPHDPADRITKVCGVDYDPAARGEEWAAFLARVLPDFEVRGYLQRLTGVALLGKVVEHVLAIATGTGANGKSTFVNAVCTALGDYASTLEPDLFMHRQGAHPTGEMDLLGTRLAVVSESEKDRRLAEATMKRLTGGDTIRARRMRQDFVEFAPSHTPLLVTNHLPKVSGDDPAIWRRIRVIPFGVEIPPDERDKHLDEKLAAEASAVLGWAIAGYQQYAARGDLAEPASVLVATDAYRNDSDAVARFVAEECITSSPAVKATTSQLHDAWARWAVKDGAEAMSLKAFGQSLDRLGYPPGKAVNGKRWRAGIALETHLEEDGQHA